MTLNGWTPGTESDDDASRLLFLISGYIDFWPNLSVWPWNVRIKVTVGMALDGGGGGRQAPVP